MVSHFPSHSFPWQIAPKSNAPLRINRKVDVDEDDIENETMPPLIDIIDLNEEELLGVASRKASGSIASYVVLGMEGEQSELSELDMID